MSFSGHIIIINKGGVFMDNSSVLVHYDVPNVRQHMISDILRLGKRHSKVILKKGWCYGENGSHAYLIENYALFRSFGFITRCICPDCINVHVDSPINNFIEYVSGNNKTVT